MQPPPPAPPRRKTTPFIQASPGRHHAENPRSRSWPSQCTPHVWRSPLASSRMCMVVASNRIFLVFIRGRVETKCLFLAVVVVGLFSSLLLPDHGRSLSRYLVCLETAQVPRVGRKNPSGCRPVPFLPCPRKPQGGEWRVDLLSQGASKTKVGYLRGSPGDLRLR